MLKYLYGGFMTCEFNDTVVNITIIRKNNKNIYFRFKDYDQLEVTCNHFISDKEVIRLINKNYASLNKMYLKTIKKFKNQEQFTILGHQYTKVYDETLKDVILEDDFIYLPSDDKLNKYLKKLTKDVFQTEINKYKQIVPNIPEFKLRIRKMTTRWGVCNRTLKVITLNSDLIYRERTLLDYVIVHEMCHFYEGNHSKAFWHHVEKYYPNYKYARKELREN